MEEGGFGDLINVGEEREGGVENDAKVADAGGGCDSGSIDAE